MPTNQATKSGEQIDARQVLRLGKLRQPICQIDIDAAAREAARAGYKYAHLETMEGGDLFIKVVGVVLDQAEERPRCLSAQCYSPEPQARPEAMKAQPQAVN